jgi:hypothetical protein
MDIQTYFDDNIDIHHIFPQKWCNTQDIDPKRYDSVINKTALSARTNRIVGGNAPSVYLGRLQNNYGISEERMNEILISHVISPDLLRGDDFDAFYEERERALLDRIEGAMGKPLARDVAHQVTLEDEVGAGAA